MTNLSAYCNYRAILDDTDRDTKCVEERGGGGGGDGGSPSDNKNCLGGAASPPVPG